MQPEPREKGRGLSPARGEAAAERRAVWSQGLAGICQHPVFKVCGVTSTALSLAHEEPGVWVLSTCCVRRGGPRVREEEDQQEGPQVWQELAWLHAAKTVSSPEPDTNLLQQTEQKAAG